MNTKNLRIGNYIEGVYTYEDDEGEEQEKSTLCEVVALDYVDLTDHSIWVDSKDNIETFTDFIGIPLTEQWLLDFGFEKKDFEMSGCFVYQLQEVRILVRFTYKDEEFGVCIDGVSPPTLCIAQIKHVHQLQNFYFALNGKELEIKQDKNG